MQLFPHPKAQAPQMPLVDNVFAPEILAMGVSGLSVMNGIVTITFESARCDHSRPRADMERLVVARVSMPIPAAQSLLTGLHAFMGQYGLSPVEPATCQ